TKSAFSGFKVSLKRPHFSSAAPTLGIYSQSSLSSLNSPHTTGIPSCARRRLAGRIPQVNRQLVEIPQSPALMVRHHPIFRAKAAGLPCKSGFDAVRVKQIAPLNPHGLGLAVNLSPDC